MESINNINSKSSPNAYKIGKMSKRKPSLSPEDSKKYRGNERYDRFIPAGISQELQCQIMSPNSNSHSPSLITETNDYVGNQTKSKKNYQRMILYELLTLKTF